MQGVQFEIFRIFKESISTKVSMHDLCSEALLHVKTTIMFVSILRSQLKLSCLK